MKIWRMGLPVAALVVLVRASEVPLSSAAAPAISAGPAAGSAAENLTLRFQGTAWGGEPVDVSLTSVGPAFSANLFPKLGDNPSFMQLGARIKKTAAGLVADLNIGQQISIASSNASGSMSVTFRGASTQLSVLLQPGQPVPVLDGNGQNMTVTLTQSPVSAPAAGATSSLPVLGADGTLGENLQVSVLGAWLDGSPVNYSTLTATGTISAMFAKKVDTTPGTDVAATNTIRFKLTPEPGGGYRVDYTLLENFPTVDASIANSVTAAPTASMSISYRSVSASGTVVVKNLNQPVELIARGKESLVLNFTRPAQK